MDGHVGFLPQGSLEMTPKLKQSLALSSSFLDLRRWPATIPFLTHTHKYTHTHSLKCIDKDAQESQGNLLHSLSQNHKTFLSPKSKNSAYDVDYSN